MPQDSPPAAPPPGEEVWNGFVERTASGDQSAMAELYDASSARVFGLAVRILGERNAAEDAVVEVYAQAWRDASSFDAQRGNARAWLLTIARSRAIDILRSRRREPPSYPLEAASEVHSGGPGPEEQSSELQRRTYVRGALDSLRPEQREAIELAYFSDFSHSEIASKLGQPLGTIKTRIRSGMMALRELLQHMAAAPVTGATREGER
ncbi:sigma-70 family RNA polymerase sigma factor [Candidatus Binatus sp.]|uniref:sigma-70 family RNA polymerase sigma factor n=1 Tax=Candidatus Binatus sp. TaxID=2811406 RepID=UPI003CC5FAF8